jgi:hypothetical protein
MLEDGGTGLPGECNGIFPDRDICTVGTFSSLLYIQRNMTAPNVLTSTQLITPTPRNTCMVHVRRGKQIAVLEEETHNECRGRRISPRWYNQSAAPILKVPMVAAITCNVKISNIKIPLSIDTTGAGLV